MEVEFEDPLCQRMESDPSFDGGYGQEVLKAFRKRMQLIRNAPDERDFYALKSLHFEKLLGRRAGQYSMRLNSQWRLILKISKRDNDLKVVIIVAIDDYH